MFLNPPAHLLCNYMSGFQIKIGWVQQKERKAEILTPSFSIEFFYPTQQKVAPQTRILNPLVYLLSNYMSDF